LFALPACYHAMQGAFDPGELEQFKPGTTWGSYYSTMLGFAFSFLPSFDFNGVLINIKKGLEDLPEVISAVAYLLGLLIGVAGLLKIREHVENPEQVKLYEGVIRLLTAGALFALPAVYEAMYTAIMGDGNNILGNITSVFGQGGLIYSTYGKSGCNPLGGFIDSIKTWLGIFGIGGGAGSGDGLGDTLCNVVTHAGVFPAFLTAIGYLIGLVLGVAGILKIKAHVLDPSRVSVWEGLSRLLAGGAFFALPGVTEIIRNTMTPISTSIFSILPGRGGPVTEFNKAVGTGKEMCSGLDGMTYCMMADVFAPMHILLNFFTLVAGTILIMIGISRLIKSTQEGAKGPGGFGTIMTFGAGGALISYNTFVAAVATTITGDPRAKTFAKLTYGGIAGTDVKHAEVVIGSIIKFMILVGLISFVRGIFIVREVAEGHQQASLMAGLTHIIGGVLAVNLGPLINAVQMSLGISDIGIAFS
jgi:hypothetical protein